MPEVATPKRVQLRRTKGYRKPEGAIVVARPSRWGNPFLVGNVYLSIGGIMLGGSVGSYDAREVRWLDQDAPFPITVEQTVILYREHLLDLLADGQDPEVRDALGLLRGHDLACWCPLDQVCHADVLLEVANGRRV